MCVCLHAYLACAMRRALCLLWEISISRRRGNDVGGSLSISDGLLASCMLSIVILKLHVAGALGLPSSLREKEVRGQICIMTCHSAAALRYCTQRQHNKWVNKQVIIHISSIALYARIWTLHNVLHKYCIGNSICIYLVWDWWRCSFYLTCGCGRAPSSGFIKQDKGVTRGWGWW